MVRPYNPNNRKLIITAIENGLKQILKKALKNNYTKKLDSNPHFLKSKTYRNEITRDATKIADYILDHFGYEKRITDNRLTPNYRRLYDLLEETEVITGRSRWSIGQVEGKLMQFLVKVSGTRNAVEIGTFTGFSALMIAEALPDNGLLVTCESRKEHAEIALRYIKKSPHENFQKKYTR